jgi:hypothetical protein
MRLETSLKVISTGVVFLLYRTCNIYCRKYLAILEKMFIKQVSPPHKSVTSFLSKLVTYQWTALSFVLQVIIEGFKSYRERTVLEPFHPNLNVIGKDHEILA